MAASQKTRKPFAEHATCAALAGGRGCMASDTRTDTRNPCSWLAAQARPGPAFTTQVHQNLHVGLSVRASWLVLVDPAGPNRHSSLAPVVNKNSRAMRWEESAKYDFHVGTNQYLSRKELFVSD